MEGLFWIFVWLIQAFGFGFVGDGRMCGFGKSFLAALVAGPFVAMTLILASERRPPM